MRFLHTADWHLGRRFHGVSLIEDQAHLLQQWFALIDDCHPDAIFIAGDVYDRALPSPQAVELLDNWLGEVVLGRGVPVVLIAGNHDSPVRLDFAARLLARQKLYVRGPYQPEAAPLVFTDAAGPVTVCPLPYAEPPVVREALTAQAGSEDDQARLDQITQPEAAMAEALAALHRRHAPQGRRILLGHAFVSGGEPSPESERPLTLGGVECVSAELFAGFDYVALGHLHRPQAIACGGAARIHYAGSLLKYSFSEAAQEKSVNLVEMDAAGACRVERVRLTPRRECRCIEGRLAGLLAAGRCDDYLKITLLDEGALHDPLDQLRGRYPNVLQLARPAAGPAAPGAGPEQNLELSLESLFGQFYETVTGAAPTPAERRAFAGVAGRLSQNEREA